MKVKPFAVEEILDKVAREQPEFLPTCLKVVLEEYDRWARDNLTQTERNFRALVRGLGTASAKTREQLVANILNKPSEIHEEQKQALRERGIELGIIDEPWDKHRPYNQQESSLEEMIQEWEKEKDEKPCTS